MGEQPTKDLVVLVADQDMHEAMGELLQRTESLGIRPIKYSIEKHLRRDPGCRTEAATYLRTYTRNYRNALVMFDREGCGSDLSRNQIQSRVERDLAANGWGDRCKAIVIDPELEAWVWNGSNRVSEILGCGSSYRDLKAWLREKDIWPSGSNKPSDPKKAMRAALRKAQRRVSARIFGELASSSTLHRCNDSAFSELRDTLERWFPAGNE